MRKPDFFVVGAPKCGTTAMHEYFGRHPEVFVTKYKDHTHHFDTDLYAPTRIGDRQEYLDLFAAAGQARRAGEACAWYLYSKTAAAEIHKFNPSARIIIMVRNPVDVLYSLHRQYLYNGNEDLVDFAEALAAEPDRKAGRRIPPTATVKWCLQYRDTVRFAEQIERYLGVFGPEQVHTMVYDDFRADTAGAFRRACRFLGVAEDVDIDFRVVNPNKVLHSLRLTNLLRRILPRFMLSAGRGVIPRWLYLTHKPRPPMDAELRGLRAELAGEVARLGELLGRDLTGWSTAGR